MYGLVFTNLELRERGGLSGATPDTRPVSQHERSTPALVLPDIHLQSPHPTIRRGRKARRRDRPSSHSAWPALDSSDRTRRSQNKPCLIERRRRRQRPLSSPVTKCRLAAWVVCMLTSPGPLSVLLNVHRHPSQPVPVTTERGRPIRYIRSSVRLRMRGGRGRRGPEF